MVCSGFARGLSLANECAYVGSRTGKDKGTNYRYVYIYMYICI